MGTEKRERQKAGRQARLEAAAAARKKQEQRRRFIFLGGAAVLVVVVIGISIWRGSSDSTTETTQAPPATTTAKRVTTCPAADGSSPKTLTFEQAPPMCIDPAKKYSAAVSTDKGDFTIDLEAATAPITVNNFVVLSRYHYYDGVPFHRVVTDYVIQTGDPNGAAAGRPGLGSPGYTITDENPADTSAYVPGAVAMANTGAPNSGGSQWFVYTGPNPLPGPTYARFGLVTQGLDTTVKEIFLTASPTGDAPASPAIVKTITITET
jgi:cyclophilin family peptidyl-prolyl cis-trans isomerase